MATIKAIAMKVLIVDDEKAARQRLGDLLSKHKEISVVGRVAGGTEALVSIEKWKPDVVFLDVQMPGMSGIDVAKRIRSEDMPAIVFVTAYDQYAIDAFDLAAIDYLLKPFDDDRFEESLARAKQAVGNREIKRMRERIARLFPGDQEEDDGDDIEAATPAKGYLERIAVDTRGRLRIVPVERIDFITASGSYAELHVGDNTYVIREKMQLLEERLDPNEFCRVHRGTIVRIDRIESLHFSSGGKYWVRMHDGRSLKVSRSRWDELSERFKVS